MDDYESGWELHVSSTSNSIHFDCKIFELEVIHGCSAVVHTQNSSEGLILSVNNSINNDTLTPHSLEVKVQNEMELYFYAVFPLTSKGIIGSNPMKGSIRVNNGKYYIMHACMIIIIQGEPECSMTLKYSVGSYDFIKARPT